MFLFFRNYFKLHYWPIITGIWFLLTFAIAFIIAGLEKRIYFPFISDTGTFPPESCIFGQMLNIGAVLFAIMVYIRYRQVKFSLNSEEINLSKKWNTVGLWWGIIVAIGISIVGNFQETAILLIHGIGAALTFGGGTAYLFVQTVISYSLRHIYKNYPECEISTKILYFRIFLTTCCGILVTISSICMVIAFSQFTGTNIAWWTEEHGGFEPKLVATFSEWIIAALFAAFIISMTKEYKLMEYEEIKFKSKYPSSQNKTQENSRV